MKIRQKGIVLLMVLWIMVILSTMALSFLYMMRLEIKMAKYQLYAVEAFYLAKAGLYRAIAQLTIDKRLNPQIDTLKEGWSVNPKAYEDVTLSRGSFNVKVIDESSKVNINTASPGLLRNLPVIKDAENRAEICDSIIDWRDTDSNHELNGAEDNYYQSLPEPYDCKDGPLDTIEELLLVKGIDEDLLKTPLRSGNGYSEDEGDGLRLKDIITVYGDGKVNVNTADLSVLSCLLGGNVDLAQSIIEYRAGPDGEDGTKDDQPFNSISEVKPIIGEAAYGPFSKLIKVNSDIFRIISIGRVKDSKVTKKIEAVIDRSKSSIRLIYYRED